MDSTKKVIAPRRLVVEADKPSMVRRGKRWLTLTKLKLECGHQVYRRVVGRYAECKACPKVAPGQRDHAPLSK